MQSSDSPQLDLPALVQTVFLAIQQLAQRQDRTQQQLDQFQQDMDQFRQGMDQFCQQSNARQVAIDRQIAANADQIAANTAGLVELRNLVADVVRGQR